MFPENVGPYLTIDETSLSQGELYTVITNKEANGKKGCLVAMIKGVDSNRIKSILHRKIPLEKRRIVKEVTLDMARQYGTDRTKDLYQSYSGYR
ncbi:transposase [Marinoscillum sp.]|uniref:transposase n=1 Tax=Marinoscillum sp. TaxID=2024838 RepID=UPI003BA8AB76